MNLIHLVTRKLKRQIRKKVFFRSFSFLTTIFSFRKRKKCKEARRQFPISLLVHLPLFLVVLSVLLVVSNTAISSSKFPTAAEVLSKAAESESTVDYVGKRIVIDWHLPETTAFEERVIHQKASKHITELLTPIDTIDFRRKRDRDDRSRDREPGKNKMSNRGRRDRIRRMLPPPPPQDIWREDTQLLLRNYTVDVALGEPIAGRNTYLLTINPKATSRPRKKVWLDAQHYIILRMEDYDIKERLKSLYVYTTIDYDSTAVAQQLKQYQQKESQSERRQRPDFNIEETSLASAEKKLDAQLPQPSYLPVGFELQGVSVMTFHGEISVHRRYTDGLTVFSLFVSKLSDKRYQRLRKDRFRDQPTRGDRFRSGKPTIVTVKNTRIFFIDQVYIRILQWEVVNQNGQKNLRFVLIGELSQEELVKVAASLIP